jgi:hypothetical protein
MLELCYEQKYRLTILVHWTEVWICSQTENKITSLQNEMNKNIKALLECGTYNMVNGLHHFGGNYSLCLQIPDEGIESKIRLLVNIRKYKYFKENG